MLDSEQLRVFLAIVREGTTVAAARRLGIDHSTASRRLSGLEQALGTRLFDRSPRGLAPTAAAAALVGHAERIESELIAAMSSAAGRDTVASGTVRLATPEMFGTYLVAPNIAELAIRHPDLTIELAPESRSISLSKREADIAIMLRPPPKGRLVARKLADYRLGLYATSAYLERAPKIASRADVREHGFVSYIEELIEYPELRSLDQILPGTRAVFRSTSSAAQQAAVAAGIGLGLLHLFAAEQDPRLVRILPDEVEVQRSYWLVVHADLRRLPRIRAAIDFLEQITRARAASL
jgi:DNA-binding transcriptional LysR family regulator